VPTVNGSMYPEARPRLTSFNEFNVLIVGGLDHNLRIFVMQVDTLHVYIRDYLEQSVRLKLHCSDSIDRAAAENLDINWHPLRLETEDEVRQAASDLDIDIIFDRDSILSKQFIQEEYYVFQYVGTAEELTHHCESFLAGSGITWQFANIAWYTPINLRYYEQAGMCKDYFHFMAECMNTKGYTMSQQERVRYIANRLSQVEYARDLLRYYVQRMRKADRMGYSDDDYNFELAYHLSNYYFLIVGALDSVARLINDVYKLGLTRYSQLSLLNNDFVDANRRKRTGFVRIVTKRAFTDWFEFMKDRRNFIAHEGDMRQSPFVEQNETPLTDEEVEQIVDRQSDWVFMATILTQDQIEAMRNQASELVRVQHDYKTIDKFVMNVPNNSGGGTKLYMPLRSIEFEHDQLTDVMIKLLDRLKK